MNKKSGPPATNGLQLSCLWVFHGQHPVKLPRHSRISHCNERLACGGKAKTVQKAAKVVGGPLSGVRACA